MTLPVTLLQRGLGLILSLGLISPQASAAQAAGDVRQLMVKLRSPAQVSGALATRDTLRGLSVTAGMSLRHVRPMSRGVDVVRLPRSMTPAEADVLIRSLAQDPNVEWVEVDRWVQPLMTPNDSRYPDQWNLHDASSEIASANLPGAWDLSTGAATQVIAVIDTGLIAHADFGVNGTRVLPGFDFVSDLFNANDGDGRDTDASDPGDWVTTTDVAGYAQCDYVVPSLWHGTHVAGIIAAIGDNGLGVAGINWNAKLLPVRVLGKCGGYLSDVLDGARWAAGLGVPGVPGNANPARVINLSLGSVTNCSSFIQSSVNEILATGTVIVAAAGNNGGSAGAIAPGNCAGVIAVAALDRQGNRAYYSSAGATVALSAPGGAQAYWGDASGILSLVNAGTAAPDTTPTGDSYNFLQGTSMSAPHAAGVASLMLSLNPALTPAQVRQKLRSTARVFPAGSTCTTALCGAGMLDATAALQSALNTTPPVANAGDDKQVDPGTTVTLDASASSATMPVTIMRYVWTQLSGTPVTLSDPQGMSLTFTAPDVSDTLSFQLTVIDDGGLSASDTVQVQLVAVAASTAGNTNTGGGGGGGCFIATAAYGTAAATEVKQLRAFRDEHLLTNAVGRAFVATYYKLSPAFADAIRPHPWLRALVRVGLVPYVTVARWFGATDGVLADGS